MDEYFAVLKMRFRLAILCLAISLSACELPGPDRNLRYAGDAAEAQVAVASGAGINATDPIGQTPLIIASRRGREDVVKYLLLHGAYVNAADMAGNTAISEAYDAKHDSIVQLLLANGANPLISVNGANVLLSVPASALPPPPYDPVKQGACLGRTLDVCLKNLQAVFDFKIEDLADQIKRNDAVDVNGSPMYKVKSIQIHVSLNKINSYGNEQINIVYSSERLVNYIDISLPMDPAEANTADEYASTGLYQGIGVLLGSDCPKLTKEDVYKFFQNQVKKRIVDHGRSVEDDDESTDVSYTHEASDIPFCGRKFTYTQTHGYEVERVLRRNKHDAYSEVKISFQ